MIALSFPTVANQLRPAYSLSVVTLLATGRENPNHKLAHMRPKTIAGAFFVPAVPLYGGRAWAGFGLAGCQLARFLTPRTAAAQSREKDGGSSKTQVGAPPMQSIRTIRAAAHRRMAFAALHADSSLSTRLARYTHHITKARALEAVGGAQ